MTATGNDNDLYLSERLTPKRLRAATPVSDIQRLTISRETFVHRKLADELAKWPPIKEICISGTLSKAALRRLLSLPGTQEIHVTELHQHGNFCDFDQPSSLRAFSGNWLSTRDLSAITQLQHLETLGAQNSSVNRQVIEQAANSRSLRALDLEASNLNDDLAKRLATSSTITKLEIGATRLGPSGFQEICKMTQLRELDIWALDLDECDLDALAGLPNLEYVSVGGYDGQMRLTSKGVLPRLAKLPSLQRVWLDGISVTKNEAEELKTRYKSAQVTFAA